MTVDEVNQAVEQGRPAGLIGHHETFLPLWQFSDNRPAAQPGIIVTRVLNAFVEGMSSNFSPDLVVLWAATEQEELGDREPRSIMFVEEPDLLEWSARRAVAELTH
ncbi:hypothetical protein [Streptomyces sp. NRRL S-495]|uniref:hypothetical protein n=1 Tax=Streptomyces sp. NRRL S-495 TaxID=1609133 RepID=UPI0005F9658A|nr:hypothetical protein [Streptomyces sp. NRRL S-495]KJY25464.1 hypothetical protein VR45_39250 [Streptomyces sp. NRRL S-495]